MKHMKRQGRHDPAFVVAYVSTNGLLRVSHSRNPNKNSQIAPLQVAFLLIFVTLRYTYEIAYKHAFRICTAGVYTLIFEESFSCLAAKLACTNHLSEKR